MTDAAKEAAPQELSKLKQGIQKRNAIFQEFFDAQQEENKAKVKPIKVTMNGKVLEDCQAFVTTPQDIANRDKLMGCLFAVVNEAAWDMGRALEDDCTLELVNDFENPEASKLFWHSSAHALGYAMESELGATVNIGPPLEEGGFFYEANTDKPVTDADYKRLEKAVDRLAKGKHSFQRALIPKEKAMEMFEYNPYKHYILATKVPDGASCAVYRCGDFVDPCRGPHLLHTAMVRTFKILKHSSSYWQGDCTKDSLQRVYATSFPTKDMMKDHVKFMEQAKERDHRRIGTQQQLFMFHELSPGCAFWLPHGARIYNTLVELMRNAYRSRGFSEVVTPNMFHSDLWKQSGHWDHYEENIFKTVVEKQEHAFKPMNCPSHMLMFGSTTRSYKELPLRFADFGVLHRNELSGSLTGLTRVRRFQQDDAHIFCRQEQLETEMTNCLDFMKWTYDIFGFDFVLNLSTRNPTKFMGDLDKWDDAEEKLAVAMCKFCSIPREFEDPFAEDGSKVTYDGSPLAIKKLQKLVADGKAEKPMQYWKLNPGDGAFYGPKIDIQVSDCMRRKHQCATIQLDFNLPERFNLTVAGPDNAPERPVVIHRAILGSVERQVAILCEHWGGKWPFWLSPRQFMVIPITHEQDGAAQAVADKLCAAGFHAEADCGNNKFQKKVALSQTAQWNMALVMGAKEVEQSTVNVRLRKNGELKGEMKVDDVISWAQELVDTFSQDF